MTLSKREQYLVETLATALDLLHEIVPLAEAYIRENFNNKIDTAQAARKFIEDYHRHRLK